MPTEIWVALIAFGGTAIGSVTGVLMANRLATYRIEQLEKKVDKHNSVMERTQSLETNMKNVCDRLCRVEDRLDG